MHREAHRRDERDATALALLQRVAAGVVQEGLGAQPLPRKVDLTAPTGGRSPSAARGGRPGGGGRQREDTRAVPPRAGRGRPAHGSDVDRPGQRALQRPDHRRQGLDGDLTASSDRPCRAGGRGGGSLTSGAYTPSPRQSNAEGVDETSSWVKSG